MRKNLQINVLQSYHSSGTKNISVPVHENIMIDLCRPRDPYSIIDNFIKGIMLNMFSEILQVLQGSTPMKRTHLLPTEQDEYRIRVQGTSR